MKKPPKAKAVKAWAGITDGKFYFIFSDKEDDFNGEAVIYRTRKTAKKYFEEVRRVEIRELPRRRKK